MGSASISTPWRPTPTSRWSTPPSTRTGSEPSTPRLVVACFTPFGLTGPYAGYRADDITLYALGGPMIQTGVREREPLKLAGNQIQYQWGAVGAVATLGAVLRAEATGEGALLDIAGLETQVGSIDRQINHLLWRQWTGREVTRASRGASALLPSGYFPCLDGYVATVFIASWLPRLLDLLDDPELRQRCASPDWATDPDLPGLLEAGVYSWLADRTRAQAMADGARYRLPFAPFNGPADLHVDPHFVARGFFVDRDGDRVPRPPLRFHPPPDPRPGAGDGAVERRPARRLGARPGRSAPTGGDPGAGPDRGVVGAVRHDVAVRSRRRSDPGGQPVVLPGHHPGQLRPPGPGGAVEHRPLHRLLSGHGSRRPPVEPLGQLRRPLP